MPYFVEYLHLLLNYFSILSLSEFYTMYVHSPHEIISTAGKTRHNLRQKRNRSLNLFIHISNKSASIKTKDIPIESSKLFCLNLIQFYSKSC